MEPFHFQNATSRMANAGVPPDSSRRLTKGGMSAPMVRMLCEEHIPRLVEYNEMRKWQKTMYWKNLQKKLATAGFVFSEEQVKCKWRKIWGNYKAYKKTGRGKYVHGDMMESILQKHTDGCSGLDEAHSPASADGRVISLSSTLEEQDEQGESVIVVSPLASGLKEETLSLDPFSHDPSQNPVKASMEENSTAEVTEDNAEELAVGKFFKECVMEEADSDVTMQPQDVPKVREGEWTVRAVRLLCKEHITSLAVYNSMHKTQKTAHWGKITRMINATGATLSEDQVKSKWRKLLSCYKAVKDNRMQFAKSTTLWKHFQVLEEFFRKAAMSTSVTVDVSSSSIVKTKPDPLAVIQRRLQRAASRPTTFRKRLPDDSWRRFAPTSSRPSTYKKPDWSLAGVRLLCRKHIPFDANYQKMPRFQKTLHWRSLAKELQAAGFRYTSRQIARKWVSLWRGYTATRDNPGSGPEYVHFALMDRLFQKITSLPSSSTSDEQEDIGSPADSTPQATLDESEVSIISDSKQPHDAASLKSYKMSSQPAWSAAYIRLLCEKHIPRFAEYQDMPKWKKALHWNVITTELREVGLLCTEAQVAYKWRKLWSMYKTCVERPEFKPFTHFAVIDALFRKTVPSRPENALNEVSMASFSQEVKPGTSPQTQHRDHLGNIPAQLKAIENADAAVANEDVYLEASSTTAAASKRTAGASKPDGVVVKDDDQKDAHEEFSHNISVEAPFSSVEDACADYLVPKRARPTSFKGDWPVSLLRLLCEEHIPRMKEYHALSEQHKKAHWTRIKQKLEERGFRSTEKKIAQKWRRMWFDYKRSKEKPGSWPYIHTEMLDEIFRKCSSPVTLHEADSTFCGNQSSPDMSLDAVDSAVRDDHICSSAAKLDSWRGEQSNIAGQPASSLKEQSGCEGDNHSSPEDLQDAEAHSSVVNQPDVAEPTHCSAGVLPGTSFQAPELRSLRKEANVSSEANRHDQIKVIEGFVTQLVELEKERLAVQKEQLKVLADLIKQLAK